MDFSQLQNFVMIARLGNLTKAADTLHISQPAMSSSLSRLEDELHTQLFDRNGRRLLLNDKGQIFYDFADKVLEEQKELMTRLQTVSEGRQTLTLYLVDSVSVNHLIPVFQKLYPNCMLRLIEIERKHIQDSLLKDDCDFVVDAFVKPPAFPCESEVILYDEFYIAVSDKNPLYQKDVIRIEDLRNEKFVVLPRDEQHLSIADELCLEYGFRRNIVAQCFRSQIYPYLIDSTALSFASAIQRTDPSLAFYNGHIRLIRVDTPHRITNMLLWKKHKQLSKPAQNFLEICRDAYAAASEDEEIS